MSSSLFPYTLTLMRFIGMWPPRNKRETLEDYFAIIRATVVFLLTLTFTISQILQIIILIAESKEFLDSSFFCCTSLNACFKVIMILTNQKYLMDMVEFFNNKKYIVEVRAEFNIQQQMNGSIKYIANLGLVLVTSTTTVMTMSAIFIDLPKCELPLETWSPFDLTDYSYYVIILIYQLTALTITGFLELTLDIFFTSIMLQCCAQMRILEHRFKNFHENLSELIEQYSSENIPFSLQKMENTLIKKYVVHHSEIYRFVEYSNAAFAQSIFVQYSTSSFIICASVYSITRVEPFSAEFIGLLLYILCMFFQLFIYCGCGNEITVQSLSITDAVYSMNWNSLNIRNRNLLMIVMMRAQKKLEIAGGSIFILSLSSLTNILKLAYSIYNFFSNAN